MAEADISTLQVPCQGVFGRWFGHKYKGRYNLVQRPNVIGEPFKRATAIDHDVSLELARNSILTDRTYSCDICVRCGHVRERFQQELTTIHNIRI